MLYLIHGKQTVRSRKKLSEIKKQKGKMEIVPVSSEDGAADFISACESRGLFSGKTLVVVEAAKKEELKFLDDSVFDYLEKIPDSTDVVFWVGSKIKGSTKFYKRIKKLGRIFFFEKKEEKPFDFLDYLASKNSKKAFLELRRLLAEGEPPAKLVYSIAWEVKTLLQVKGEDQNPGIHPYVYKKTKQFSKNFSECELLKLFESVYELDLSLKTGGDAELLLDRLTSEFTSV